MSSLFFRALSLAIRFGCPLLILYLTDSSVLGSYYLFTTFFTVAIFFIALELAIPFSRLYLRAKSDQLRKKVFTSLVLSQGALAALLGLPIVAFHAVTTSMSIYLSVLFYFALVTGAYVNEVGRFFWNIGLGSTASKRNFLEAIIFAVAIIVSISVTRQVVAPVMLWLMIILNLLLVNYELKKYGAGSLLNNLFFSNEKIKVKSILKRVFYSVKESAPQVIHVQILSIIPYIERILMEKTVGLAIVGSYSFQFSLVQSGASLILVPAISEVRKNVFKATTALQVYENHKKALMLLVQISAVSLGCGIASYFFLPIIAKLMHKEVVFNIYILLGAFFSVVVAVFSNAVSPFFASKSRLLKANILTLLCMLPFIVTLGYVHIAKSLSLNGVMLIIVLASSFQLLIRLNFHFSSLIKKKPQRGPY